MLTLKGSVGPDPDPDPSIEGKVRKSWRSAVTLLFIRLKGLPLTTMSVKAAREGEIGSDVLDFRDGREAKGTEG